MVESSVGPLVERFSGLERQMEAEVKTRRGNADHALGSIKDTMARLQLTLDAEIQRREEANTKVQTFFDSTVISMKDKLQDVFMERFDQVHSTVESLNDRMAEIEKGFSRSRGRYIKDAEDRSTMTGKEVDALRCAMRYEFENRREREAEIAVRLREAEESTAKKLVSGEQMCNQKFEHLHEALQESRLCREAGDRRFQACVIEEVSSLKDNLVRESQAREQADDDIVLALNHYTKELQRALRVVNQV